MKAWVWLIIASVGMVMMVAAYSWRGHVDQLTPWASGVIVVSPEVLTERTTPVQAIPARARLLSSSDVAEILLFATGGSAASQSPRRERPGEGQADRAAAFDGGHRRRRAPVGSAARVGPRRDPGRSQDRAAQTLMVGGRSLKVVGVLKPGLALFATSFLVPPDAANDTLFPTAVPSVLHAWLVRTTVDELRNARFRKPLEEVFPPANYAWITVVDRLPPRSFYLYLCGLAIFLLGGSAMHRTLSLALGQGDGAFSSAPLLEMKARPRLVWGVHLAYFGVVIAGSLLSFAQPDAQTVLLAKVREAGIEEQSSGHRGPGLLERKHSARRGRDIADQLFDRLTGLYHAAVDGATGCRNPAGGHSRSRVGALARTGDTGSGPGHAAALADNAARGRRVHPCHALRPADSNSCRGAGWGQSVHAIWPGLLLNLKAQLWIATYWRWRRSMRPPR